MAKVITIVFLFLLVFLTGKSIPLGDRSIDENHLLDLKGQDNEMGIFAPDQLCLYFGSVIGDFYAGGDQETDIYSWKILNSAGSVLVEKSVGFQIFSHTFSTLGEHEIQLKIRRGLVEVFSATKKIQITKGADLILESSNLLCDNGTAVLTILDLKTPFLDKYVIQWKNSKGEIVGNSNSIVVNKEDVYAVNFYTLDGDGGMTCPFTTSTFVYSPKDYALQISKTEDCEGGTIIHVTSDKKVYGNWYYRKGGSSELKFMSEGSQLSFTSSQDLEGPGEYEIVFEVDNKDKIYCKIQDSISYKVLPSVDFSLFFDRGSENCEVNNGVLLLTAFTDIENVQILGISIVLNDLKKGQIYPIPNLAAGVYHARGMLGNCSKVRSAVVPLLNQPNTIMFNVTEIIGETCTDYGELPGSIKLKFLEEGFKGSYKVLNTRGDKIASGTIESKQEFEISIGSGFYYLEIKEQGGCKIPYFERFEIPMKEQVTFSAQKRFTVCESFEYTPEVDSLEDLSFTLTYPDGDQVTKIQGESFTLDQAGEYFLLGFDLDTEREFCPRELNFEVTRTSPIKFEPELDYLDCFGNKTYSANLFGIDPSKVVIKWYNEKNEIVGNGILLFPTSHGEFKLDVQPFNSEVCPVLPKTFNVEKTDLEGALTLTATPYCPSDKRSMISLEAEFEIIYSIKWIYYDPEGNIIDLPEFQNYREVLIENEGVYEVVVYNKINCELGRNIIKITETNDFVEFTVPNAFLVCESYALIPETDQDLIFTLILPDGKLVVKSSDEAFTIDQGGEYFLSAISTDLGSLLCPITKSFQVVISQAVDYDVAFVDLDCSGISVYKAEILGLDPNSLTINWYDADGLVIGNNESISLTGYGDFYLEVFRKGSLSCPNPPISFAVQEPILYQDLYIVATGLCPEGDFSVLTLDTDASEVFRVEWYYTDFKGDKIQLFPSNPFEILAEQEGTYEVLIFSRKECMLGTDQILVMRSMDALRPSVDEAYIFCPEDNIVETIDPGMFKNYKWYFEGNPVATSATFKPAVAGKYSLVVTSEENCEYSTDFTVVEECEFKLMLPNALKYGDPDRSFMVYANGLIETLEVWVFDKWGGLIFHCANDGIVPKKSACLWDGTRNGEKIPAGAYAVKLFYTRSGMIGELQSTSIMVLD